jgi:hypothetical protein
MCVSVCVSFFCFCFFTIDRRLPPFQDFKSHTNITHTHTYIHTHTHTHPAHVRTSYHTLVF